ncbi:MAG: hypothetical protein AAF518_23635, partial [Spirochaetota bacterium]
KNLKLERCIISVEVSLFVEKEDVSLKEAEYFQLDRLETSQILIKSLKQYVATNDPNDTSYQEFYESLFLHKMKKSATPEGAFAKYDKEKISQVLEDRINGMQGDNLYNFLMQRRKSEFLNIQLGQQETQTLSACKTYHMPAIEYQLRQGGKMIVSGSSPFIWRFGQQIDILLFCNTKIARNEYTNHILSAYIFLAICRSGLHTELQQFLGKSRASIYLAHKQGICRYDYPYESFKQGEYREYMESLLHDCVLDNTYKILPFQVIGKARLASDSVSPDASESEYYELLTEKVVESIQNEFNYDYQVPDYLQVSGYELASNVRDIVQKRIDPILKAQ